tara:strand:- start:1595 stop:2191 length:597 start_codon:yes stop_codon:yes gene_type:complete
MKLKISELHFNENNPRIIKDGKFKKLVKSIKEFPEMLELRPIVVDENNIILGGNMRTRACIEAGIKEVPVKIAKGLTPEQKNEFIIKDNASFGIWEWDKLSNEWNTKELDEWGVDVWQNIDDEIQKINSMDEWVGMPEFEAKENPYKIVIIFESSEDREEFQKEHNIKIQTKLTKESNTWSTWWPFKEKQDLKNIKFD